MLLNNNNQLTMVLYSSEHKKTWDDFVARSKNGNFIFYRDYMEYHSDRFQDHSLMIYQDEQLIALLPGHIKDDVYCSHNGLTYGGFLIDDKMKTPLMLDIFQELIVYLKGHNCKKWLYKTIPYIHHQVPAEEDRYALFRNNAILWRRDVMPVVFPGERLPFQERRQRGVKKAVKKGLNAVEDNNLNAYWQLLSEVLWQQHQVKPVHSLEEMIFLQKLFPDKIKLYSVTENNVMLAGVLCYQSARVWRAQYIASSLAGRDVGALDLIFAYLLEHAKEAQVYFDFGPCNEDNGKVLNVGLIEQKEGFGARAVVHDFYEMIL